MEDGQESAPGRPEGSTPRDLRIRVCAGHRLSAAARDDILRLCTAAYEEDFAPYLVYPEPVHVLGYRGEALVSHALWVTRWLQAGSAAPRRTAYVEAVATDPMLQGRGFGTQVMINIAEIISENHRLGALGTGSFHFYERLGWQRWRGPSGVRTPAGVERTSEDDGFIMVLLTEASMHLDLSGLITCDWRPGDVW